MNNVGKNYQHMINLKIKKILMIIKKNKFQNKFLEQLINL